MENASGNALQTADVAFEGDRCVSRRFGDVYFSADGPDEVRRVFLAPAAVAERAQARDQPFTIAELGFGTGLNLVVAAAATRARLHFVSFEGHPLSRADLAQALKPWRHDYPLVGALVAAYPPPVRGWHRRFFESGRVQLSVFFGDVGDGLTDLRQQQRRGVDAWFLDGFAPKRNPDMWRDALFADIAALSAPGATATTFSAAGDVRRRLAAHGFKVRRVDQRPHKRHSTAAVYAGTGRTFRAPREAVVVGAGLAGAATARCLVHKGIAVTLLDRGQGVASGASAIPAAVLHPRLLPTASVEGLYRLQAFLHAAAWLPGRDGVTPTGVLQLAGKREPSAGVREGEPLASKEPTRLRRVAAAIPDEIAAYTDPHAASELVGTTVRAPGLFFPNASMINGKALALHLVDDPNIAVLPELDTPPGTTVIRATGTDVAGFSHLEVGALAGQLDRFACDRTPRLPIVGDGVIVPDTASVWTGATYEYRAWDPDRASEANAARYAGFFGTEPGPSLSRFRGTRAVTSDRLPVIGPDGDAWFNLGHGSHGTISAIFGAEIIASAVNGELAPATCDIRALLEPARFRARQLRRPNPFRR
ncbi:MAG: tRNA (5-methylaminomethyl-2-thiouridine)(34)-methyltransferase MnmD [Gammaproteobacteria bacterium]|nr:tRNA (5-methylaminomethyl-2-thiouridine)(34)-methyltransferase MnmD [Gammaproteobacteria bacterium]